MSHPSHTSVARTLFPTDQHAADYAPPVWTRTSYDPAVDDPRCTPICFEPLNDASEGHQEGPADGNGQPSSVVLWGLAAYAVYVAAIVILAHMGGVL